MNILITGVNGFVGRALIRSLKETQHKLYALDLEDKKDFLPGVFEKFYAQDITSKFSIDQPFDIVFHLAACNLTHVGKTDYQAYYDVNVQGTKNLIQSSKIKRLVFLSTAKVYESKGEKIDELSPVSPLNSYEKSKLEAEDICRKYFSDDNLTIFRSVNVVGEGQAEKAVIPVFFKNAMSGRPLEIVGSGRTKVQLLYVQDVVNALMLILKKEGGCGIVNLAGEEAVEVLELAERIVSICGSTSKIICNNTDDVIYSKVLAEKAKNILAWQATVSVDEILQRYFDFCQKK